MEQKNITFGTMRAWVQTTEILRVPVKITLSARLDMSVCLRITAKQ